MRIASAVLICSMILLPALAPAQNAQPTSRPNPAAGAETKKKSAPAQPGRDLNAGLSPADRVLIQLDLAWTGFYNGLINGEFNDKTIAAVKAFQKDQIGRAHV